MSWYTPYLQVYEKPFDEQVYQGIIQEVREGLASLQSDNPLVTVSVIAYNEEKHLLACLWALSKIKTRYPIEIIGVDNASSDKTSLVYEVCGLPFYREDKKSPGFARQCGMDHAKGRYHIFIDSDTVYPPTYVETMIGMMEKDSTIMGVGSTWTYFSDENHSKLSLYLYTRCRDAYLWLLSFQRPELCVRGMVFAFRLAEAKRVGIRTDIIRGEDGSLAFGLRKYGRIAFIRNSKVRAVTGYGTVGETSLLQSFMSRGSKAFRQIRNIFTRAKDYKDDELNMVKTTNKN